MKLKLDENGKPVMDGGKYVFIKDDGSEISIDVGATYTSVAALRNEAKTNRERAEAAETKLAVFGELDPEKAKKALEVMGNLDAKKLIDAGEVEKVKAAINEGWQAKLTEAEKKAADLERKFNDAQIGTAFGGSKFIGEKVAVPLDMMRSMFGSRFKVEGDKIVGYDAAGNKLHSRSNPGADADFDEAISIMVDGYAHRDTILKASTKPGTGPHAGGPGNPGGAKQITRQQFDAMPHSERATFFKGGGKVAD